MTTHLLNRPPGPPPPAHPPAPTPAPAVERRPSLVQRAVRPYELKRTTGRIAWFIAVAMVGLAIAAFVTGKPFSLGTGDNTFDFPGEAGTTGLAADRGAVAPAAPVQPVAAAVAPLDLTGTWTGNGGTRYQFFQSGSSVSFDELDAFGSPTASASGQLVGDSIDFTYETVFFTGGTGFLEVVGDDGNALSGQITDLFSGITVPLVLTR